MFLDWIRRVLSPSAQAEAALYYFDQMPFKVFPGLGNHDYSNNWNDGTCVAWRALCLPFCVCCSVPFAGHSWPTAKSRRWPFLLSGKPWLPPQSRPSFFVFLSPICLRCRFRRHAEPQRRCGARDAVDARRGQLQSLQELPRHADRQLRRRQHGLLVGRGYVCISACNACSMAGDPVLAV